MTNEASPLHRSALLLHAMGPSDREWVLGRLPDDGRRQLHKLLGELHELGIPADRSLLAAVRDEGIRQDADQSPQLVQFGQLVDALRGADPQLLAAVLCNEPTRLVGALLCVAHWPWEKDFLQRLEPLKRRQVAEARQHACVSDTTQVRPNRMAVLLLASVHARLEMFAARRAGEISRKTPPRRAPDVWASWLLHRLMKWRR